VTGGRGPIRVCLDARVRPGKSGGIEQFISRLSRALLATPDPEQSYVFLVNDASEAWLAEAVAPGLETIHVRRDARKSIAWRVEKEALALTRKTRRAIGFSGIGGERSNGAIEAAGVDVMHFTTQSAFFTRVPFVYQPHDLQHRHLPEYFSAEERLRRDGLYRVYCAAATAIAVSSEWTRGDLMAQYGVPGDRVFSLQYPPPDLDAPEPTARDVDRVRAAYDLPRRYLYYAATTFPHKNHVGLVEALSIASRRVGERITLVCTGGLTDHHAAVVDAVRACGVEADVRFPGFVSAADVRALYAGATGVVIPTLFESASFPLWEAMRHRVAVACSNVTSLGSQAGDAAIVFDPGSVDRIVDAICSLWADDELRFQLAERGAARVAGFTAERSARAFQALYHRVAGRTLTPEQARALTSGGIA